MQKKCSTEELGSVKEKCNVDEAKYPSNNVNSEQKAR
jgi:hypothetical protein